LTARTAHNGGSGAPYSGAAVTVHDVSRGYGRFRRGPKGCGLSVLGHAGIELVLTLLERTGSPTRSRPWCPAVLSELVRREA